MAPVDTEVTLHRKGTPGLCRHSSTHGNSQRVSIVVRVKGNFHALGRILCLNIVIGHKHAGGIVHAVVGDAQADGVLAPGKVPGHTDNLAVVGRLAADASFP